MFKNNTKNSSPMKSNNSAPDRLNRIVEGTQIVGDFKAESNIRIDGYVKGTVYTDGKLVIGVTGVIEGDIECENADIEGKIIGNLKVNGLLALKHTANIEGDISTQKLAIEPGATFTGQCKMGKGSVKANTTTANSTPKANKEVPADDVVY